MVILKPRLSLLSSSPFSISLQGKHGKLSISYNGQKDWNKKQDMILSNNRIISFWGTVIYVWLWKSVFSNICCRIPARHCHQYLFNAGANLFTKFWNEKQDVLVQDCRELQFLFNLNLCFFHPHGLGENLTTQSSKQQH